MRLPARQLVTIVVTLGLLIAILVMKQRCGATTAQWFEVVSSAADGGPPRD